MIDISTEIRRSRVKVIKVIRFWSLNFSETYVYYICIYLLRYMGENVKNNFPMGSKYSRNLGGLPQKKNKMYMGIWIFQKNLQKYRILGRSLE